MNILITGATGLIGKELGKKLVKEGHKITVISRNAKLARLELPFPCDIIEMDLVKDAIRDDRLKAIESVVHLMGEGVGDARWTSDRKRRIYESRVRASNNLLASFPENSKLKVLVSASAIGYYGHRADQELNENASKGVGFLSDTCQDWETPFLRAQKKVENLGHKGIRFVQARLGVVLSPFAKSWQKMFLPFRLGLGSPLGTGQQWMSWVHLEDAVNVIQFALQNSALSGPVNVVSPDPLTNLDFTKTIAKEMNTFVAPAVPAILLKTILGEMSCIVLDSQKVVPQKLLQAGFVFKYAKAEIVVKDLTAPFKQGQVTVCFEQYIEKDRKTVFHFFSEAKNLEKITPESLSFHILNMSTAQIQKGTEINYKLKIHGFPVRWKTLIADWKPSDSFIDNQLSGPYSKWHHTHRFEDIGAGTLMTDYITYKVPMGYLGWLAAGWFVGQDVQKIFNFRRKFISDFSF